MARNKTDTDNKEVKKEGRPRTLTDAERKERKAKYDVEYHAANIKRIPLDVQIEFYKAIKSAAEAQEETVNGYIKQAILKRIESGK